MFGVFNQRIGDPLIDMSFHFVNVSDNTSKWRLRHSTKHLLHCDVALKSPFDKAHWDPLHDIKS